MKVIAELRELAKPLGITVEDRGNGHVQLRGTRLVNYYPLSKRRTAYVDGTQGGSRSVSPKEAILMALTPASGTTPRKKRNRKSQRKAKLRLLARTAQINGMYRCWYCPSLFWPDELSVEHLIPVSLGGTNTDNNKVLACRPCNSNRGNKMPHIPPMLKGR